MTSPTMPRTAPYVATYEPCDDVAMRLDKTLGYRAAPDAVFAMMCDKAWRERVCELAHARSYDVAIDGDDANVTVSIRRVLPAAVPDAIKKFLGETVDVRQVERWGPAGADGTRRAELSVDIHGQPATMRGTGVLSGDGSASTWHVTGDVKVAVPLFGRKIEPEVAKAIDAALKIEERAAVGYLA